MNVNPALRGAIMNSEFNTRGNTRSNAIRNKNKTRKAQARPFIPVRPLSAAAGIGAANESKNSSKYGHLDYSTELVDDKKLEEIEFDIWSPEKGDYTQVKSFDETGRYFIAQFTIFTQGGHLIYFVDNHGQKHRYARRGDHRLPIERKAEA